MMTPASFRNLQKKFSRARALSFFGDHRLAGGTTMTFEIIALAALASTGKKIQVSRWDEEPIQEKV